MDIGDRVYPAEIGGPALEDMFTVVEWADNFRRVGIKNVADGHFIWTDPRAYKMYRRKELPRSRAEQEVLQAKTEERRQKRADRKFQQTGIAAPIKPYKEDETVWDGEDEPMTVKESLHAVIMATPLEVEN